jgi:enediyne polyketide synthase
MASTSGLSPGLLALTAPDLAAMRAQLAELRAKAGQFPMAELGKPAARLPARLPAAAMVRCAIVAATPDELRAGLADAEQIAGAKRFERRGAAFAGSGEPGRLGLFFPGQGAPALTGAGGLAERLPAAAAPFARAELPTAERLGDELVQLAVVASSVSGLAALRELGVEADLALGHSLGELTALHWAGAYDEDALLRIARARGAAMTAHASARGTMATVRAAPPAVGQLAAAAGVSLACLNSPRQCVVAGEVGAVKAFLAGAREAGFRAMPLRVVGAFHSPLMRPAVPVFERCLVGERFEPLRRPVISTVSGAALAPDADLRRLLLDQIVSPVRFAAAAALAATELDLIVEVGPGRILAPLLQEIAAVPVVSMRVGDGTSRGLVEAAAAAFAAGRAGAVERLGAVAPPAASP